MVKININKQLHGSNGDMDLDIKLDINQGDFIALTGDSGSGKTTLLRIIAGLEKSNGSLEINGDKWLDDNFSLVPQKRNIGFVFQDYALFPNMTVEQNLTFVKDDKDLLNRLLEITELSNLRNRMPNTLSGGQQQRVSLCRALMNKPQILLMDEPLSALDNNMRIKLQNELLLIHEEFNLTTIMVSHNTSEIFRLANRVIVLNEGQIKDDGVPNSKSTLEGELLDIKIVDDINIATVSIGQQLVEIVVQNEEVQNLKIGDTVMVGTKAIT